ncbi:MAG: hypothetical protein N2654_03415 [Deltaproteobacteria bacterium]|nr:hypothetical protein [Deltaproteobacteria bacterium]
MPKGQWFFGDNSLDPYRLEAWKTKRVVHSGRSSYQLIEVVDLEKIGLSLFLDSAIQFSAFDEAHYHELFVHPACSVIKPSTVLILGGGDGGCLREVCRYKTIKRVILCEIDHEVIDVCKEFFPALSGSFVDSRVELHVQDALELVKNLDEKMDLILVDLTDLGELSKALYTAEFMGKLKELLTENGAVVMQTSGLYYLKSDPFRLDEFVKSLRGIFKHLALSYVPIYSFPGGENSFIYLSENMDFLKINFVDPPFAESLFFYTPEYAQRTFTLPKVFVSSTDHPSLARII